MTSRKQLKLQNGLIWGRVNQKIDHHHISQLSIQANVGGKLSSPVTGQSVVVAYEGFIVQSTLSELELEEVLELDKAEILLISQSLGT